MFSYLTSKAAAIIAPFDKPEIFDAFLLLPFASLSKPSLYAIKTTWRIPQSQNIIVPLLIKPNTEHNVNLLQRPQQFDCNVVIVLPPITDTLTFTIPRCSENFCHIIAAENSFFDFSLNRPSITDISITIQESNVYFDTTTIKPSEIESFNLDIPFCTHRIHNVNIGLLKNVDTVSVIDIPFFFDDIIRSCHNLRLLEVITAAQISDYIDFSWQLDEVVIVDIPLLRRVRIDGKIYNMDVRKENLLKFRNFEKEQREKRNKETYLKVGRQYAEEKPNNRFDIFDIIFPILQPPLGNEFNNPIIFPANPYPFQVIGIKFLMEHTAALLGDEMGLGKTVQTITAIRALMRQGKILTACVICPKAVLSNWERELWKWSPELRIIKIEGLKHKRESQWQIPSHIYICTYEALRNDFDMVDKHSRKKNKKSKTHFDLIVLDEIQKTKNPAAALTRTVRSIDANYRWGLSGTPLENGINDLITICETLKPDMFDNLIGDDWGMGIDAVKDAYKPYFLRRKAKDVLTEMPEKNTQEVWLDLLSEQQKRYNTAESTGIIELEEKGDSVTRIDALALITKLKLICNYDDRSKESVKLDYLKEELEEITEDGKKALVFSQFPNETLKKIETDLHEYKPFIYDGSLSDRKRTQYVDDFQNLDENKIMMLSSKAGNAGITLTRANYVYHFDLWWNPAVAAQSLGRALRIGQKEKVVFERYLLTKGTIEERIYLKVQEKRQLFNRIVDDLSDETAIAKNFTDAEIFGLLGLKNPKNPKPINAIETFTDVPFEPKTQQQIDTMAPLEFEEFICLLYEKRGYHVLLTQKSYDGGVDILAKRQAASGYEEVCIQCKHKENSNDSVGVKEVREFSTAVKDYNPSAKAVLVTNGIFSNEAEISARRNNIELINGANLQGLMKKIKWNSPHLRRRG